MAITVPADLVDRAREGGDAEIEQLLRAAWPDAYRLARAILGQQQAAEDAAQEACIILYRTIRSLRSASAFRVWFYRIVVREAAEIRRRRARQMPAGQAPASEADSAAALDVWRALSKLPENLRNVVVLRYFEDLPSREIASVLGTTDGAVRFRLVIAKRRLRPLLDDTVEPVAHDVSEVHTTHVI